tara:strand:+ start:1265 stop:1405 length:141 start_codon:yes stop_codon:yes gene_type:complete
MKYTPVIICRGCMPKGSYIHQGAKMKIQCLKCGRKWHGEKLVRAGK